MLGAFCALCGSIQILARQAYSQQEMYLTGVQLILRRNNAGLKRAIRGMPRRSGWAFDLITAGLWLAHKKTTGVRKAGFAPVTEVYRGGT
jgi:hypothetical protein